MQPKTLRSGTAGECKLCACVCCTVHLVLACCVTASLRSRYKPNNEKLCTYHSCVVGLHLPKQSPQHTPVVVGHSSCKDCWRQACTHGRMHAICASRGGMEVVPVPAKILYAARLATDSWARPHPHIPPSFLAASHHPSEQNKSVILLGSLLSSCWMKLGVGVGWVAI